MNSIMKSFDSAKTLQQAVSFVKSKGCYHRVYSLYTNIDRIREMLTGKTYRLWLTRLDSGKFDDGLEGERYGAEAERSLTYIKCFMSGSQESAAMWGLYCPPTYKAIRLSIPQCAMLALCRSKLYKIRKGNNSNVPCDARSVMGADLVYAAVEGDVGQSGRSHTLFWNGQYTKKIFNLQEAKCWKNITGLVKDIEWKFENEFRLVVKVKKESGTHIAIELPDEFIKSLKFTLSPWANNDERSFVKGRLVEWLRCAGRIVVSEDSDLFKASALSHGLKQWAQNRGLQ